MKVTVGGRVVSRRLFGLWLPAGSGAEARGPDWVHRLPPPGPPPVTLFIGRRDRVATALGFFFIASMNVIICVRAAGDRAFAGMLIAFSTAAVMLAFGVRAIGSFKVAVDRESIHVHRFPRGKLSVPRDQVLGVEIERFRPFNRVSEHRRVGLKVHGRGSIDIGGHVPDSRPWTPQVDGLAELIAEWLRAPARPGQ